MAATAEQAAERKILRLNPGRQTEAAANPADILIYGGAGGGGKTEYLFFEGLRHIHHPSYVALYLRRTMAQVTKPGGSWERSLKLLPQFGLKQNSTLHMWKHSDGGTFAFGGLEYEWSVENYQTAEFTRLLFDECCQFTSQQFWYMQTRLRNSTGLRTLVRGACNPDPDSFVKSLIRWWLDEEGRYADQDKAGQIRWMVRDEKTDFIVWWDESPDLFKEILAEKRKENPDYEPKSVAFVPAKVDDNPYMLAAGYKSTLQDMSMIDRERMLNGDWLIRPSSGTMFKPEWFGYCSYLPKNPMTLCRYWDRAYTKRAKRGGRQASDPDYVAGVLLGRTRDNMYFMVDVKHFRGTPQEVEQRIFATAQQDREVWGNVHIGIEQDPAGAGNFEANYYSRMLSGFNVGLYPAIGSKIVRATPFSSQVQAGNVVVLLAPWNQETLAELQGFPDAAHDDIVDACSGAFNALQTIGGIGFGDNWL